MQWVVGISSCQVNLVCSQVTRQSPERPQITWQAAFATVCTGVHRDAESSPVFTKPGPGDPTLGWTHAAVLFTVRGGGAAEISLDLCSGLMYWVGAVGDAVESPNIFLSDGFMGSSLSPWYILEEITGGLELAFN